jgi:hypothetical protein
MVKNIHSTQGTLNIATGTGKTTRTVFCLVFELKARLNQTTKAVTYYDKPGQVILVVPTPGLAQDAFNHHTS